MNSGLKPLLLVFAITGIAAGGVWPPGGAGADPYAPALAPWDSQYAGFGSSASQAPRNLMGYGDQALAQGAPQRMHDAKVKAMEYYESAMSLALRTGDKAAEGEAALKLARLCFDRKSKSGCTSTNIVKIIGYFENIQARDIVLALTIRRGDILAGRGKPAEAEYEYSRATWQSGTQTDLGERTAELAMAYHDLAWEFFNTGDFERSLRARRKSEALDAGAPDRIGLDAETAALDNRALDAAAQKISELNQAEAAKAAAAQKARSDGKATGSIGAPAGACPGMGNSRELCEMLRSLQEVGTQPIKPQPLPAYRPNQ